MMKQKQLQQIGDPAEAIFVETDKKDIFSGCSTGYRAKYKYLAITYSGFVSSATKDDGEHKRTWGELHQVIKNKFGTTNQYYLT